MAETKLKTQALNNDSWNEIGAAGKPAFEHSWVNYGAPYNTAAYMKDAQGFVHLKGLLKSGTTGSSAFTLPAGYRPAATILKAVFSNNAFAWVTITAAGAVEPTQGSNASHSLDCISFRAEN